FEILINLSVQFHHSAIKISPAFQKIWALLFVPPFLHRIHHSLIRKECDSNYGVIFSIWDRLAGTLKIDVDQEKIVIGTGSHRNFEELDFWRLQLIPFKK
ncbi:MAG: sterol desaturase family protein, partial [Lentisphaerae bacterium]|nr:sterol desaturase family protein [Lentisphaerota bacterium]